MERQLHWVFLDTPYEEQPYKYVTQERCNCGIGHNHHENDPDPSEGEN